MSLSPAEQKALLRLLRRYRYRMEQTVKTLQEVLDEGQTPDPNTITEEKAS